MGQRQLSPEALEKAREFCVDEYIDYVIYKELAARESDERMREVLERFSEQEYRHYKFWSSLAGECQVSVPGWKLAFFRASRKLLGLTFTLKYLERHEKDVIESYRSYMKYLEGEEKRELERIIRDEEEHEKTLISGMNENIVRYLSFIALGLADAIVEITGVHAGFLGATKETLVAGIAGLIVGVSAALSMSGAAYLQAKADVGEARESPGRSAIVTGVSYLLAVIVLALPYFLTQHQITAFIVSVVLAIVIVSGFTYYNSVLNEKEFKGELLENLAILFGTAIVAYMFGEALGSIFGIQGIL